MNVLWRGSIWQRLRLASGLVLFTFAATHFLNHALGLVSLEAMNAVQDWRVAVTRSIPGSLVLGLALVTHVVLALAKTLGRGTLALRPWEWLQLILGLSIPFFLFPHIVNTRGVWFFLGVNDVYAYELARLWPGRALDQSVLLLIVWLHGCLGLHYWLRLSPWYQRIAPVLLAAAVLVPVLALAGFMVQGREILETTGDPARFAALKDLTHWPDAATDARVAATRETIRQSFYWLVLALAVVLAVRLLTRRLHNRIAVQYLAGPVVKAPRGMSLLEISRANGIPHLSVCGGRARCSTCRVRILEGLHELSPPTEAELATLASIKADPDVRLACQARPRGELTVLRLLSTRRAGKPSDVARYDSAGVERTFAVLFVDIRGFTKLSEEKLAYDVVFILNRFFHAVGTAIEKAGGRIEKYMGDGLLAVFEDQVSEGRACTKAFIAAAEIDLALDGVNADLANELKAPLAVAMGMHSGTLVVGQIGWGDAAAITVIGPTVNVASRLESIAKAENMQFVFSEAAARTARLDTADLASETYVVKGLAHPMEVMLINRARELLPRLDAALAA